jgi:general secretion pathway protein K
MTSMLPVPTQSDGAAPSFDLDGIMIKISIQDELGKLDLNQAEAPLLLGLLESAGLDFDSTTRLADKIVD